MSNNPYLLVTEDAYVVDARAVLDALGLGPSGIGRPLVGVNDEAATPESQPLAWCQLDMSGTTELVSWLNGLCNGALPPGPIWGEEDVISSVDAQDAYMHQHSAVVSLMGVSESVRDATIAGALSGLGYKFRPDAL